jgi:hypothetical protein
MGAGGDPDPADLLAGVEDDAEEGEAAVGRLPARRKEGASETLARSKNCRLVMLARSTSEKTAPKAVTNAGLAGAPGSEKVASVTFAAERVKMRTGLNAWKIDA